ncbi:MAG: alpha-2-macroglobulin, partial [Saprospiraceae bacterium]|nr:alpha-2-macroglobulin [Saprospiraceae bacterium]
NAYGTKQCEQLLAEIKSSSIVLNVEKVNLPDQHILTSIQYANLDKVFVRVVPSHISNDFEVDNDGLYDRLLAEKPIQTREWAVQNPGDYQQHTTELAVNPLPFGSYWLLISDNPAFDRTKGPIAFANFFVSNLSGAPINENGKIVHIVTDRREGAPLANVKMDYYTYDYNSGRRKTIHAGSGTTDQNGVSRFKSPDNQYLMVRASLGKDSLWIGQSYNYIQRSNDRVYQYVHFFTDRSLYRPGQSIYFKGLLFEKTSNGIPEIIANQYVTVQFNDANGQKKGELRLKSNEYGTFNGAFTAPSTGLMGAMTIVAREGGNGMAQVQVEEYKRPRFEVTTKPVEGSYRLNEKINLSGEAKNYAGNAVDGAQVRYRVVREARFPFYDFYRRWIWPPMPASPAQEITSGTTTTDADGAYKIEFQAIPDLKIKKKDQPVFDYQVYIDVTDITGETRSTTAQVSAGYAALQVNWALSNEADIETMRKIELGTSNMSGQAQAAEGQITMQRLVEPKQFYVSRYWNRPDITTIAQTDFQRMFPDFAWKDEDEPEKWGRQDFTRTIRFNTATQKTVDLHEGKTQPGWYILKLTTKDSYGEEIEIQKVVRVYDEKSRFEAPFAQAVQASVEPGQTAKILMGGKPANLHFFFARDNDGTMQDMRWVKANEASQSIEFPVKESDRGGIPYVCFAIKNNRFYALSNQIAVPWSNKQLQISFETFRDKLSPGQKEEWRIKISGPKKEKVAAELTAAMYDASLDAFKPHNWSELGYPYRNAKIFVVQPEGYQAETGMVLVERPDFDVPYRIYPEVNWFLFPLWMNYAPGRPMMSRAAGGEPLMMKSQPAAPADEQFMDASMAISEESAGKPAEKEEAEKPAYPASIRRNLNETVFFFPDLHTDADGNVILKFTMNEALTRWKLLTYAHTQDLKQAVAVKEVVTQKELMVIANPPRFLREGDEMEFSAKVSNLSQEKLEGTASLNLLDAATLQSVEKMFGLAPNNRIARFSVLPGQSAAVSWRFKVPENYNGAVTWQIFADGKAFRDGEESTIPVVSNRMLVTETMPISLRGNQTKKFVFENFKQGGTSTSLLTHNYTLEFTSNPAWYVVQSLPYLMEYPHECSEQIFSRYYANTLASSVVNKMPQIKRVFDRWQGTDAMLSNLSKNQELKYALLEETPWVLDAQSEEQQRKNIALLFDLNRMANEQEKALRILQERQQGNGGWAWFPGSAPSWYITQYIATGLMHLQKLGAVDFKKDKGVSNMLDKALGFCDEQLKKQYAELEKLAQKGQIKLEDDHLDGMSIQYLYLRSFSPLDRPSKEVSYYLGQADKYWLGKGLYQEGMLALALHRWGNKTTAQKITASLRERATLKEELGMYWPAQWGFYWYQLPIETQALMVEVFGEVANDAAAVENLRIWLLKNKQTNRWESTKATAEAAYALLLFGENWLENTKPVQVSMSGKPLKVNEYEAGTGYFKQSWTGAQVEPSWAEIKVENPNSNIVWGAAYWQYFEDLDKIRDFKKTPLTIVKQLFLEENSAAGPVLKPIAEGQALHRGDKVKVRIEIRVDRPMEFVHLKDMRAAGLEPVNVLSGYRYQGGLGYYESTKDLATHFFIDYLPRGTFVFEYPLVVSNRGNMSNGITTMQCMYAPEFTSHSKGIRIKVE